MTLAHILMSMTMKDWLELGIHISVTCSVIHTFAPPWEAFSDFPTLQKYYKLFIYLIGYMAVNFRSSVYTSLSTANGTTTSKAANGSSTPPVISPIDPEANPKV